MKRKRRKSDIMDLVTLAGPEAVRQVDELGYSFLAAQGYDVVGWDSEDEVTAREARERIMAALEVRGEWLVYHGGIDDTAPRFAFWYTLRRGRRQIAASRVILFKQKPKEGETM